MVSTSRSIRRYWLSIKFTDSLNVKSGLCGSDTIWWHKSSSNIQRFPHCEIFSSSNSLISNSLLVWIFQNHLLIFEGMNKKAITNLCSQFQSLSKPWDSRQNTMTHCLLFCNWVREFWYRCFLFGRILVIGWKKVCILCKI